MQQALLIVIVLIAIGSGAAVSANTPHAWVWDAALVLSAAIALILLVQLIVQAAEQQLVQFHDELSQHAAHVRGPDSLRARGVEPHREQV